MSGETPPDHQIRCPARAHFLAADGHLPITSSPSHDGAQSATSSLMTPVRTQIPFPGLCSRPHLLLVTVQRPRLLTPSHFNRRVWGQCECSVVNSNILNFHLLFSYETDLPLLTFKTLLFFFHFLSISFVPPGAYILIGIFIKLV